MSPGSSTSIASFSFWLPASQSIIDNLPSDSRMSNCAGAFKPPCVLALESVTKNACGKAPHQMTISTLPTMLIYLIRSWLTDQESLQLIFASQLMHHEVQRFYQSRLRAPVAQISASPIASHQNSIHLRPALVPMGADGELMFQECSFIKSSDISEAVHARLVGHILQSRPEQRGAELLQIKAANERGKKCCVADRQFSGVSQLQPFGIEDRRTGGVDVSEMHGNESVGPVKRKIPPRRPATS